MTGKRAIVTGGAAGIGFGISTRLAEAGASVLIVDMNPTKLAEAQEKCKDKGWKVAFHEADVSDEAQVKKVCQEAVSQFGGIDILVNNAGIYPNMLIMNAAVADFDKVLAVNLRSVFMTTKYTAEQMITQGTGGRIINITSIDALHPSSVGLAPYDASKHGLWGFTKNAALELSQHNIWVNAVAPGGIITPGVQEAQQSTPAAKGVDMTKVMDAFLRRIPMRRMGEPDDIGKAVLFLASDMASYMTGSQIVVDGGVLLA